MGKRLFPDYLEARYPILVPMIEQPASRGLFFACDTVFLYSISRNMDPITEWWMERAAIMEYDANMDRADAEYAAFALVLRHCERTGARLPTGQYFDARRLPEGARVEWSDEKMTAEYFDSPKDWRRW